MIQPIIEKSYLVEINLGTVAAGKQINFQFIPQLQGSFIYGIQAFSATQMAITPNGATSAAVAGIANCTVTFVVGDDQDIYQMPIYDLISQNTAGLVRMFKNKVINLTKSFVTINGVTSLNNNEAICFQFIYRNKA